jgi:CheY-like chemotaxis protein
MSVPDISLPPLRILVVDDHVQSAAVLALVLEMYDHQVETANDGPTALQRAQQWLPEAILLDLEMPGMDGCEVTQRLKANPTTRDIPIIGLSAWTDDEHRQRAKLVGVLTYLVKPVSPEEMQHALLECVNSIPIPIIVEVRK